MTKKLNPNEAPTGYVAVVAGLGCKGCAGAPASSDNCLDLETYCMSHLRADGRNVIFIKREPEQATPAQLDARLTIRLPASVKAKAQRIGAAAVIAAIEAAEEVGTA